MLENQSNQDLLNAWRNGSEQAATVLVRRYMVRLTALARSRLSSRLARRVDAEDVVMSAWRSFFVAADAFRVTVPDSDDLWPLLVQMTLRKLSRNAERHTALQRSVHAEMESPDSTWFEVASQEPTPEQAALLADELSLLMAELPADERDIVERRLLGQDTTTIAHALGIFERSVRRKLVDVQARCRDRAASFHADDLSSKVPSPPTDAVATDPITVQNLPLPEPTIEWSDLLLERMIGRGAFGRVFRGRRQSTQQTVAVKFLRRRLWQNRRVVSQIIHELAVLERLNHPGIVRGHGWGQTTQGATFLVLELLDGMSLAEWRRDETVAVDQILKWGRDLCDAVEAAHTAGVFHGDLAPSNVVCTREHRIVLTDFGFSRLAGETADGLGGTPGWLAPEQLSPAFGSTGAHTDIFGIGGILFFLLTGHPPVNRRDQSEVIARTLSAEPVVWPAECIDLPEGLRGLIEQCLSKDACNRPPSAREVRQQLV